MTKLSVNVNKVATVRNARGGKEPSVVDAARLCLEAGAAGITVHPRPDGRHIRFDDVRELSSLCRAFPGSELNVEGYPSPRFLALVQETLPTQCTLVPDPPEALTSSHGWSVAADSAELRRVTTLLRDTGIRVSLFLEPDLDEVTAAAALPVDRIELYTEPYARAATSGTVQPVLARYVAAGQMAQVVGLGVNAGHDLDLSNLGLFCDSVPNVLEVSIGHSLIAHALEVGLQTAVRDYLAVLDAPARAA